MFVKRKGNVIMAKNNNKKNEEMLEGEEEKGENPEKSKTICSTEERTSETKESRRK